MTRTAAKTTISPATFVLGRRVFAEDALEVVEQLNWSFQNRTHLHVSHGCAPAGWGGGSGQKLAQTLGISFRAPGTSYEVLRYPLYIQPEVTQVEFGAAVDDLTNPGPNDQVQVSCHAYDATTGTLLASVTLATFDGSADNDTEKTAQFNTSTIGTGVIQFAVEIEAVNAGGGTRGVLRRVRIQDKKESTLPAPVVEGGNGETLTVAGT